MEENRALQIFNYEDDEVRTIVDEQGEPWWVAADVCEILGLSNVSQAVNGNEKAGDPGLDEDEKLTSVIYISGQNRNVLFVNEPGLYSLIFKSRKPEAKAFKRWVTHEVLPAIRKTGHYSVKERALADIQAVIRVTAGKYTMELLQFEGEYRIDSRQIAPNLGTSPEELLEEIREFTDCLEYFGRLVYSQDGEQVYALLNKNQALFILGLERNTGQIIYWKMALIDALDQLEKRHPTTGRVTTWQLIGETKISKVTLTKNEREVIAVLRKEGRPLTVGEIAEALPVPVSAGTMAGRLRYMERLNFVEGTPDGRFIPLFW